MPIFSRPDGKLIPNQSLVRRMLPYLMPSRNESIVLYEEPMDVTGALAFIERWNAEHGPELKITIFHVVLAAVARAITARPGLDRFVAGGRIYQRNKTEISFVVKKEFRDEAPLSTVKLELNHGEPFADLVARVRRLVAWGREEDNKPVDKELRALFVFPGLILSLLVKLVRLLDAVNLLPGFMTKNDPMYASIFLANLGSFGIGNAFHHLYEYGTVSLFGALGEVRKMVFVGPDDQPVVRWGVSMRWSFDERIGDGHYAVASLAIAREHVEHPELLLGSWPPIQHPGRARAHGPAQIDVSTPVA
jgi:pyruvate/2-oxoglutarate dehydrogenase complex dihydrolipoamide acyltransferase (E2) component